MENLTKNTDQVDKGFNSARSISDSALDLLKEGAHGAKLFGEGLVTGAVLNPINCVIDIADASFGKHMAPLRFDNQQEVNGSIAGNAGQAIGILADVSYGLSKSSSLALVSTILGSTVIGVDQLTLQASVAFDDHAKGMLKGKEKTEPGMLMFLQDLGRAKVERADNLKPFH